jgi:tripartite-type tricarboxylate transporter receptor subunit TctC
MGRAGEGERSERGLMRRQHPRSQQSRGTMRNAIIAALITCAPPLAGAASAQDWPTRPITLVVPFSAGGPVDVAARLIAPRIGDSLGQQIVIENMGGAGGMTGANRVAKAAPDGTLFVLGNAGTHAYNQALYKKPLYNSETEFAPVGVVVENTKVLILRKDFPASTVPEFVAYVKANAGQLQYGSAGAGSATHIACLLLNYRMGTNVTHVPYRGAGPALQDLIAGRVDFMCEVISTGLPPIQSKLVNPIALLSTRRAAVLPDLPTALEQGLPDVDADGWNALFAPPGTPDAIIRRLNAAIGDALDNPALGRRMEELGLTVPPPERRTPEHLGKLLRAEIAKWAPPIKASGFSAD